MGMLKEKFYVWLLFGSMFGICLGVPLGDADYVYASVGDSIVEGTVWQVLDNDTVTLLNESWNVSIGCNETTTYRLFVNGSTNISGDLGVSNITVSEDVSIGDRLDVGGDIHVVDDIFADVLYVRSISIEDSLIHAGDSDTFIHFNPDDMYFRVGGVIVLRMSPTLSTFRTDVNLNSNYLWGANLSNYTSSDVFIDNGKLYVNDSGGSGGFWNRAGTTLYPSTNNDNVVANGSVSGSTLYVDNGLGDIVGFYTNDEFDGSLRIVATEGVGNGMQIYMPTWIQDDLTLGTGSNITNVNECHASAFFGDGGNLTNVSCGNPFNQDLNTTDDVNFDEITLAQFIHGKFGGAIDLSGSPWYMSGTDFQIAENLTVDHNVTVSGSLISDGGTYFRGDVTEGQIASAPEVRIGHHGVWDEPVIFFDDGATDAWGIDLLGGTNTLRFFVPSDVIMTLTTTKAIIDVPLDVTGDVNIDGTLSLTNVSHTWNMYVNATGVLVWEME